ncbi:TerB family tellurite resistance protein [Cerasicoccus maritimus]|uniref:TerB family tellurite resistance protein n=1 Tax=Cerasicoccus maritimus TaxID=490089 RepID=UPI002852909F|nr:TerB family tellurite resistance protein [Cerasicoccus maritimus]
MHESSLSLALAKVVAVAAWADGKVTPEERDCLMDLLYQLPGLDRKSWRKIQKLLDQPISPSWRTRYVNALVTLVETDRAKRFALYALERMVEADGVIADGERELISEFVHKVGAFPLDALTLLSEVLEQPMARRERAANKTERDLASVDTIIAGRVDDWIEGEFGLEDRTKSELRRLCLAGILLARVIHADDVIDERELAMAIDFLINQWKLEREQAEFIMIVSLSDSISEIDSLRVSRWLFEETTLLERRRFLQLLFEIAICDGQLADAEVDEIMHICANLRLDHLSFQHSFEYARDRVGEAI